MGTSSSKSKHSHSAAKPEKSQITTSDKARLQLKLQRDNLQAAIRKYERVVTWEHERAKEFLRAENKRKALYCLKRQRAQQAQISTVTDMLDNVQRLIDALEFAQIEAEVVAAMKDGKYELENLNKMLNIDDIERLMNETNESIEEADQINAVLSQPLSGVPDDDELLRELEETIPKKKVKQDLSDLTVPAHKLPLEDSDAIRQEEGVNEGKCTVAPLQKKMETKVKEPEGPCNLEYVRRYTNSLNYSLEKTSDMSEEMRVDCKEIVVNALEKHEDSYELAAKYVKEQMDKKFGPSWHCVIGEGFGFEITYEVKHLMYMFHRGFIAIVVFKGL